jgi:NADPH-dependent ferric siderophore reductase
MPKAPSLVGKLAETLMGRQARLLATEQIGPDFLELQFHAEQPPGGWQAGHEVQVRATPTEGRRYNVRTVNAPDHITVLAVLHGEGPGARWLQSLHPGMETTLLAGRYVPLRLTGTRRLFIGDGSALGTLDAHGATESDSHASIVVIEAPPASLAQLRGRWTDYRFLPASPGEPGAATDVWIERTLCQGGLTDVDGALLLGHAQSIQRQRRALVAGEVLDQRAITTRPYWATGKTGL